MAYENNDKKMDSVYSKRIKAGKRRTYFFDVRETRGSDFYLTITESRKRFDSDGYDRHKIFLYKEDFNKFVKGLVEAVDFVKTDLMPDFDFDAFNHEGGYEGDETGANGVGYAAAEVNTELPGPTHTAASPEIQPEEEPAIEAERLDEPVRAATDAPGMTADNGSSEEVEKW